MEAKADSKSCWTGPPVHVGRPCWSSSPPPCPVFVFSMAGGEQTADNNPKGFSECVSQEQLQAVVEDAQRMNEAVRKAVTDALIELNIGNSMERLDK